MKILQRYLEEVQQEHKLLCDNKNLVSHQLGLPVQGDGGAVVKLRDEGKVPEVICPVGSLSSRKSMK
jgi:hypothetical protein